MLLLAMMMAFPLQDNLQQNLRTLLVRLNIWILVYLVLKLVLEAIILVVGVLLMHALVTRRQENGGHIAILNHNSKDQKCIQSLQIKG